MDSLIGQLPALLGVMVAVCAVLMPVAIVGVVLYYRHRRSVEVLATVRHLAEKGLPVPAGLLHPDDREQRRSDPRSDLKAALSMLGAGIGLIVFFYVSDFMRFLWGVGALVAIVGVAQLIALWLTRKLPHDDAGHDAG
jgi:hypothetical protein